MPIFGRKPSEDKNPSTISFDIEDEFAALPKEKSVANSSPIKSVQVSDENYDDSYVCTDCQPSKFLRNSNSLFEHCKQMIDHGNINPICFYNKFSLKVKKIELTTYRKNDSSELNRLVRNTMAVNFKSEEHPNLRNNFFEVPNKKIKAELLWRICSLSGSYYALVVIRVLSRYFFNSCALIWRKIFPQNTVVSWLIAWKLYCQINYGTKAAKYFILNILLWALSFFYFVSTSKFNKCRNFWVFEDSKHQARNL